MEKKKSANRQITDSLRDYISIKIKKKEKYILAKDIVFVIDGNIYEYKANTNGQLNQSYYDRCVNSYLRATNYPQNTNKYFGLPFKNVSPLARVIYIGEY